MNPETLLGLINNAALLLALVVVYEMLPRAKISGGLVAALPAGIFLGLIACLVMLMPWPLGPGVFFDTRSVLLSVAGLFFGLVPTLVAVFMATMLRLYQGGIGAGPGILVIITSALIGLAWGEVRQAKQASLSWAELYLFGLVVGINMLLWMLTLPWPVAMQVITQVGPVVLLLYPLVTLLLGRLLSGQAARRQAEDALQDSEQRLRHTVEALEISLKQKEMLLRELHHRTRNNMQVISAMLAMQQSAAEDERLKKIFNSVQRRILAMSLVHTQLYRTQELSQVLLNEYVAELARQIVHEYNQATDIDHKVELRLDTEVILTLIDIATPCGLVLNELLDNALTHAFTNGQSQAWIRIGLHRTSPGELLLEVADNGSSVPDDFDFRAADGFGMQAVYALAEHQLSGSVDFITNGGLTCRVRLRDDLYRDRLVAQ
jgi:two-component sensor histidine kinase